MTTTEAQLDTIFLEFFQCFASLRAYRAQMAKHMSAGFFSFAEARHSSSKLMLDSSSYSGRPMSSVVQVDVDEENVFHLSNKQTTEESSESSSKLAVRKRVLNPRSASSDRERKLDKLIAKAAERSRRNLDPNSKHSKHSDSDSDSDDDQHETESEAPVVDLSRNPLMWFGVLVPPQVKQAQKDFSAALTDVIEIATLNAKLKHLADQYEKLSATQETAEEELTRDMSKVTLQKT